MQHTISLQQRHWMACKGRQNSPDLTAPISHVLFNLTVCPCHVLTEMLNSTYSLILSKLLDSCLCVSSSIKQQLQAPRSTKTSNRKW